MAFTRQAPAETVAAPARAETVATRTISISSFYFVHLLAAISFTQT